MSSSVYKKLISYRECGESVDKLRIGKRQLWLNSSMVLSSVDEPAYHT